MTHVHHDAFVIKTHGRGPVEVTDRVRDIVAASHVGTGLVHVFCHHTSASMLITENADPVVRSDLERFLARLAPDGDPAFEHVAEGPDDMPAHVRSALLGPSVTVPVRDGRLGLGTWQGIFLYEHRRGGHRRRVTVTVMGTGR
ncbi:MAG: YjbQ family protein [Deltaproteobacteria bacterium]|nr:MAG: YjbQ family protein [Deltaproteobacteria bacterium]